MPARTRKPVRPKGYAAVAREALKEVEGITSREAERSKNFFALGLISWMYSRPVDTTLQWIERRFAKTPAVVAANSAEMIGALKAIPTMSLSAPVNTIFGPTGFYDEADNVVDEMEVPMSVELLYPDNPAANEQIDGGAKAQSWNRLKRSIRVKFGTKWGGPAQ